MQQRGLVHPGMMARVQANFYPSLCTVQTVGTAQDEYGQETGIVASLAGHVDIPCRITPMVAPSEQRSQQQVFVEGKYAVALNGYYPNVQEDMAAVIDGTTYEIEFAGHDGNQQTTRLNVRRIE